MNWKHILFVLFLSVLCLTCINKKPAESELVLKTEIIEELEISSAAEKVYVLPLEGLNLRSTYDITGTIIRLLPQNTELIVLEKNDKKETLDSLLNYWYKVDTGEEIGWAFDGYLFHKPVNSKIKNTQIAKIIAESEKFKNDNIMRIEGAIEYRNKDVLTVYNNNTKESVYFLTEQEYVFLINLNKTLDWFYAISSDYETQGYIYLYDISEKSFYGGFEENERSGNYYQHMLNTEYNLLQQYKNIKRYGPLLMINHNEKIIEFLDTRYGNGFTGLRYLLFDYYPEYNEILMYEQYYEGGSHFIYNLEYEEVRCKITMYPYFNTSRTYFLSYGWESEALTTTLRIYKINDGFYEEIFKEDIFIDLFYSGTSLRNITWTNDQEAHIDCGEAGIILVKIGDEIEIVNNSFPMVRRR